MKKFSTFLTLFLALCLVFTFADVRQAFMEKSPGQFDPAAYVKSQQERFDWLMAEAVPLSEKSIISIVVTEKDIREIESYECQTCGKGAGSMEKRVRIGLVKPVNFMVSVDHPVFTADGGFVCTAAAESRNATALRVHFSDFNLPPNAAVYIYNTTGEAFGPYTGRGPGDEGDFWSHTVYGPIAYVQLRHFGPASKSDLKSARFKISEVGHLGQKFLLPFLQKETQDRENLSTALELCDYNEPCVEDASCYSGTAVNNAKNAVAHMEWISGGWIYYCSGGLIADTDPDTQIPYFLTANHCLSKARAAAGLECYFQYWTANCGGACYDPVGAVPRTLGADIVNTSRDGDFSLLQLRENPPAGSVFMGWTNVPVATADGTELFRISHPSGAPQAYSKHVVDSDYVECSSLPIGEFIYSLDVVGATEGGSSGSPVYNMDGQIVGQLYGACGYTLEICDAENNRTVDGAFAFYYDNVKQWLDPLPGPGGKMHVQSIVLSTTTQAVFTTVTAEVTIVDDNGSPVANATVSGTFSGDISGSASGVTDGSGVATLSIKKKVTVTTFTFCVDNVTHASLTYDPNANVETCDTY